MTSIVRLQRRLRILRAALEELLPHVERWSGKESRYARLIRRALEVERREE